MRLLVVAGTCEYRGVDVAPLATIQSRLLDDLYQQGFDGECDGDSVTFDNGLILANDWHRLVGVDSGAYEVQLRKDGGVISYTLRLRRLAIMITLMCGFVIALASALIGPNLETTAFFTGGGVLAYLFHYFVLRWRNRRFLSRVLRL